MVKLLTTGIWTTGNGLRFPMPQFRMDRKDAEARGCLPKVSPCQTVVLESCIFRTSLIVR